MDPSGKSAATSNVRDWLLRVGAVVAVLACIWGAFKVFGGGPNAESGDEAQDTAAHATAACERFVKDRLKAPATADFVDTTATRIADTKAFRVIGSVDSENGFGAKIRSGYACQAYYSDTDGLWHLTEVKFDDRR